MPVQIRIGDSLRQKRVRFSLLWWNLARKKKKCAVFDFLNHLFLICERIWNQSITRLLMTLLILNDIFVHICINLWISKPRMFINVIDALFCNFFLHFEYLWLFILKDVYVNILFLMSFFFQNNCKLGVWNMMNLFPFVYLY